ncbi:ribonuclease H-like domain, reverse transcriptase, RNA-dependent DNA polymerase [Tanacetum coccineum]
MKAIRQVLRYVKGTKDHGITYKHNGGNKIHGYSDSSYRVNTQEGKGTTGIIFYYGESPISWSTQKQATVALSSCESEFIAATAAATQALWLKRLLSKLTHTQEEKITIQVDNKSAIALMKNPVFHGRSKHIDTKYHFVRECVKREDIQVEFVRYFDLTLRPIMSIKMSQIWCNREVPVLDLLIRVHEAETSSAAPGEASPVGDFYESQTIDSAKAKDVYILPGISQMILSSMMQLFTFNVNAAAKLREEVVQGKDMEIADLRSRLEKLEGDATEVVRLRGRVSQLEAATTARVEELVGLGAKNTELIGQVSGLKTLRDELKSHIKGEEEMGREFLVVQDAQAKRMEEQTTELDERLAALNTNVNGLRLAVMKFKESYECQSRLGKAISLAIKKGIQDGLKVRIEHGKAGRGLENNESYDAEVEAKYLVTVKDLEYVPFPLLEDLEARKDSIIELLMASLTLGGSRVPGSMVHEILLHDALAASRARGEKKKKNDASLDLARMVEALIVTSVVVTIGAVPMSSSAPETEVIVPQESSIAVTDYQISDLNIVGDVTQNGNDMFDSSVLDIPKDKQASAPE